MIDLIVRNWVRVIFTIFAIVMTAELIILEPGMIVKIVGAVVIAIDILVAICVSGESLLYTEEEDGE